MVAMREDQETQRVVTARSLFIPQANAFPLPIGWGEGQGEGIAL